MPFGKTLLQRYLPGVVPKLSHDPSWGPAHATEEKRLRRQLHQAERRQARQRNREQTHR